MELNIRYSGQPLEKESLEGLVLFLAEDTNLKQCGLDDLPKEIKAVIKPLLKLKDFTGKKGSIQWLFPEESKCDRVLLVGLGELKDIDAEVIRHTAGIVGSQLEKVSCSKVGLYVPSFFKKSLRGILGSSLAEGLILGNYTFKTYKTPEKADQSKKKNTKEVILFDPQHATTQASVDRGISRGKSTNFARDLGNTPANDMTPSALEAQARALSEKHGLKLTILEEKDLKKLGMNLFLGVTQGSVEPPKLIIMEYHSNKAEETIALVGKGVTFDSGGISIKSSKGMEEMKFDMCGAAAVLGAMKGVVDLKPKWNVIGVIAACENMPSGSAQRPGDIVKSYSGKTVEVLNTDAEGRLILADALAYTEKNLKPTIMIDLATLTGACITALGHYASGGITNQDSLLDQIIEAGKNSGERVWGLPSFPEYEDSIKGKYADLKNIGDGTAGTILGGLFLKNFVEKTPWVHLDIAGTAWSVKGPGYIPNDGATGVGVRLLLEFIESWKGNV